MKLLSEISGEDYEGRGLGHSFLWERGQAFLLSRLALEFRKMPVYAQNIVASTWECGTKGPFFNRDYEIKCESGELLLAGTSQWLLVDPVSREILRPASFAGGLLSGDPRRADCHPCKKLKMPDGLNAVGQKPIYYSDLDSNGHVNNAVYGKIAVDFLPEGYRSRSLKGLDVNFTMETKLGEVLKLYGCETEAGFIVQGFVDGALHFGSEFSFAADSD